MVYAEPALLSSRANDPVLRIEIFQGEKKNIKDLSIGSCSYLWFRRIREIFLLMGKDRDAFTKVDMKLAREDMIETCDQYLESELVRVRMSR